MAGHYIASAVTAGPSPESHRGVNTVFSTVSLSETASGSTTFAVARIPAGARVTYATVNWNNDDLSTTTGATLVLQSRTGGNVNGALIATTAISTKPQSWNPAYAMLGYRHTASSQAVLRLIDFVGTGTAATTFSVMLQYVSDLDGD